MKTRGVVWHNGDHAIGEKFNGINKYVVATTPVDTSRNNSILIKGDEVNELKKLKEQTQHFTTDTENPRSVIPNNNIETF